MTSNPQIVLTPTTNLQLEAMSNCPEMPLCARMIHEFADSLGLALDARDEGTHDHSSQVADISLILSKELGLTDSRSKLIHIAGHLHDIGKIALPDNILKKSAPLNDYEWQQIKKHPEIGAQIVSPITIFNETNSIKDLILCHHERYDGSGYPNGIAKGEIPLGGRIIAVADSISAMLQSRPYRHALAFDQVVGEIFNNSGTQFCPLVVNAFAHTIKSIRSYFYD